MHVCACMHTHTYTHLLGLLLYRHLRLTQTFKANWFGFSEVQNEIQHGIEERVQVKPTTRIRFDGATVCAL